ncbi:hypothetical protein E2C01_074111 [Portunus trituberculatus]|uniref:Uncharacterized protein n=1 Tax=Portunus trituberculatus TaxID=210409 RepID=A0A5B7ICE6_PORTR|nr:hypothetical protein [Portunus trituberculatus]
MSLYSVARVNRGEEGKVWPAVHREARAGGQGVSFPSFDRSSYYRHHSPSHLFLLLSSSSRHPSPFTLIFGTVITRTTITPRIIITISHHHHKTSYCLRPLALSGTDAHV